MKRLVILCLEDEAEVREAVLRDLDPFKTMMRVEGCENAEDARHVLADCVAAQEEVALVLCDHLMPGQHGVDFLIDLHQDPRYQKTRKVLITGQAGLEDTVRAVNGAQLHHYIAKPWNADEFQAAVRNQLTDYVIETQDDLMPFISVLDGPRILEKIASEKRHLKA